MNNQTILGPAWPVATPSSVPGPPPPPSLPSLYTPETAFLHSDLPGLPERHGNIAKIRKACFAVLRRYPKDQRRTAAQALEQHYGLRVPLISDKQDLPQARGIERELDPGEAGVQWYTLVPVDGEGLPAIQPRCISFADQRHFGCADARTFWTSEHNFATREDAETAVRHIARAFFARVAEEQFRSLIRMQLEDGVLFDPEMKLADALRTYFEEIKE